MGKKLFVGNLSFQATQSGLEDLFGKSGTVESAKIAKDRFSGKQRGFAFIEMSTTNEAQECITQFNGYEFEGRPLSVSIAKPASRGFVAGDKRDFLRTF